MQNMSKFAIFIGISFIAALLLLCVPPMFAADPLPTSWQLTVPAVDMPPTQLVRVSNPQPQPKQGKLWDWKLIGALGINHLTTELDRRSTYAVFARCNTCIESNPFLRGSINNKPKTALIMHGMAGVGDVISIWLKSKNVKIWFLPIAVNSSLHTAAKIHNDGIR